MTVTFEPATSDRYRPSRDGGARDAPNAAAVSQGAESDATESVASALAGGITAETLRDTIASQSRAVVPARSDGDGEPRPDFAILSYLQALDGLLRDRAADTESGAENG